MLQNTDNQKFWFAARVRNCQEFAIRNMLQGLGVECYLPTKFIIRELKYRRQRVEIPVVKNLIFIRATKDQACAIANDLRIKIFYIRDLQTRSMLIVPDKQMQDFMFVMNISPEDLSVEDCSFATGTKVKVVEGDFCGVEGELVCIANHTHVVIRIPQILAATIRIPKAFLQKIK